MEGVYLPHLRLVPLSVITLYVPTPYLGRGGACLPLLVVLHIPTNDGTLSKGRHSVGGSRCPPNHDATKCCP